MASTTEANWEEISKDKEAKKEAVINHIAAECKIESNNKYMQTVGECLSNGNKLSIEILTGGLANYTYKISCQDPANETEYKLFAKLSFPYAMLFPDKPCPLSRTENEYKMMKVLHKLSPGLVATPYFCHDLGDNMKILVTQWSPVDEQFGNQFIDGSVDFRLASKIAEGIHNLHNSPVDLEFNSCMLSWFHSLEPIMEGIIADLHKPKNQDRVAVFAQEIGKNATTDSFDSYIKTLDDADCLIHGDLHIFNILVGAKPNIESLENFESTGNVVVCDWEMSHAGCAGQDIGPLRAFPISCAFAHSINGYSQAAINIISWVDTFWTSYEAATRKAGTPEEQVAKVFRQSLQCTAFFLLAYYGLGVHMDFLPIDENNVEDLCKVKESSGLAGLKLLQLGMDEGLSLIDLKHKYKHAIEEEMNELRPIKKVQRKRRSSLLRATGRRVSDADFHFARDRNRSSMISSDGALLIDQFPSPTSEAQ